MSSQLTQALFSSLLVSYIYLTEQAENGCIFQIRSSAGGGTSFKIKGIKMIERNRMKLVTAFSGDFPEAKAIQDLLMENQITATLENTYMALIAPWIVSPGGANPVNVVVKDSDLDRALKLIEGFHSEGEV